MHIVGVENFKWMCETSVIYVNRSIAFYKKNSKFKKHKTRSR